MTVTQRAVVAASPTKDFNPRYFNWLDHFLGVGELLKRQGVNGITLAVGISVIEMGMEGLTAFINEARSPLFDSKGDILPHPYGNIIRSWFDEMVRQFGKDGRLGFSPSSLGREQSRELLESLLGIAKQLKQESMLASVAEIIVFYGLEPGTEEDIVRRHKTW